MHGIPYWFSDWGSHELADYLRRYDYGQISSVIIEYTQLLHFVDSLPDRIPVKKIFTAYDIASVTFWRRLVYEPNVIKKMVGFCRFIEVFLYERKYIPRFDTVIAVSKHDSDILKRFFRAKQVIVVPNGIENINLLPLRKSDNTVTLGFIGSVTHPPNAQALRFLFDCIVPELDKQNVPYQIKIAGNNPEISKHKRILWLGYLPNVRDFYNQIDVLVAPIFAGSGSRVKLLEGLSFGKPVITTSVGAEGLDIHSPYLQIISPKFEKNATSWVENVLKISNSILDDAEKEALTQQLKPYLWGHIFSDAVSDFVTSQ
jgi:glycosyltransferase involved in cell wall biosynthesis